MKEKIIVKKIVNWTKAQDEVVMPSYTNFHFNNDLKQKTLLGGFATLCVSLYIVFMIFVKGKQMLDLEDPYIT